MSEAAGLPSRTTPVITLQVDGAWIGVRVDRMDRVDRSAALWPVPLSRDGYLGLHDLGEHLVPVMSLRPREAAPGSDTAPQKAHAEQLIAVLRVRGEPVGVAIQAAGRVLDRYWSVGTAEPPPFLAPFAPRAMSGAGPRSPEQRFWLIDSDNLWPPDTLAS